MLSNKFNNNLNIQEPAYNFKRKSKGLMFWMSEIIQNKHYYKMEGEVNFHQISA